MVYVAISLIRFRYWLVAGAAWGGVLFGCVALYPMNGKRRAEDRAKPATGFMNFADQSATVARWECHAQ